MDTKNINRQCLEKILCHLTKLICLSEGEDIKQLNKLVDMANNTSAQLNVTGWEGLDEENYECV